MTLAELFTALRRAPTPRAASPATRAHYEYCTLWVLRLAMGKSDTELLTLPAAVLCKATAENFFASAEARATDLPDQTARARWLRSSYSMHSNAVNLVSPRACEAIRRQSPPDFRDWRDGRKLFGRPLPPAPRAPLPTDDILRCTLTSWVNLARHFPPNSIAFPIFSVPGGAPVLIPGASRNHALSELDRRNLFIAAGLQLACGLRAGETAQAKWGWWTSHRYGPMLAGEAVAVKNGCGRIEVVPVDPFWRVLNYWIDRHHWRGQPDEYCLAVRTSETVKQGNLTFRRVLPATSSQQPATIFKCVTDRTALPALNVSRWLRALGWRTQKTNHALRDYTASMITMRYSLADAQSWCRHASYKTTERSYNRFVSAAKRVAPHRHAWLHWAK